MDEPPDDNFYDSQENEGEQAYSSEDIPPNRELVTYPYDPPVKTLVREIQDKELIVNPEFQRKSVWDRGRKSRLIESLLLNIPIPVCFFAEDEDGRKVVVDGQQRLRAIEEFQAGQFRLSGLQVLSDLNRKRWADLSPKQARLIENRVIRCIVISESSDPNIRFEVFERLNTGVVPLTDQELRNCVYRGEFNRLLNKLSQDNTWLSLLRKKEPDNRLRHHELILRFLAIHSDLQGYRPPLKGFLSDFMRKHRHADEHTLNELDILFRDAVENVATVFGANAFRRYTRDKDQKRKWDNSLNRAIFDIQMVGMRSLPKDSVRAAEKEIRQNFQSLCIDDPEFSDAITKATADRSRVLLRFRKFGQSLADVGIEPSWLKNLPEN